MNLIRISKGPVSDMNHVCKIVFRRFPPFVFPFWAACLIKGATFGPMDDRLEESCRIGSAAGLEKFNHPFAKLQATPPIGIHASNSGTAFAEPAFICKLNVIPEMFDGLY